MAQATEIYNLTFNRTMFNTPILWGIGKKFRLTVNIRRAILNEDAGWAEVEFSGPIEEIRRAIADLQTTGVTSTGPLTERVEPDYSQYVFPGVGRGT